MTQSVAIAVTLRNPGTALGSFISYHRTIGFDHFFFFFDDPNDSAIREAESHADVTVIRNDEALQQRWRATRLYAINKEIRQFINAEADAISRLMVKQQLNIEIAIDLAMEKGIDWLLHIDIDELFYSPHQTVKEHFALLAARGVGQMRYHNYEAVPEQPDVVDYFREVTLFKQNPLAITGEWLGDEQKKLIETVPQLPDTFFLSYSNGKSAARVCQGLLPRGVHLFLLPEEQHWPYRLRRRLARSRTIRLIARKSTWLPRSLNGDSQQGKTEVARVNRNPIVLHYPCCGFNQFWNKYQTFGAFPGKYYGRTDVIPFYLEARDVVMSGDKQRARDFFEQRVVMRDEGQINRLTKKGLLCRISAPAAIIAQTTSADKLKSALTRENDCSTNLR